MTFYNMEMPLMKVLATMELNGVRIDAEALKQSSVILFRRNVSPGTCHTGTRRKF